jgi:hypothetical protein
MSHEPGARSSSEFSCSVIYNAKVPCVEMTWRGYATSPMFRETNERVLRVIEERRADRLLGDVLDFILIGADDQQWLNENWLPRAMEAGLRRAGLIQPVYYFNRVAVENVVQKVDQNRLKVGYFQEATSAREWLATPF